MRVAFERLKRTTSVSSGAPGSPASTVSRTNPIERPHVPHADLQARRGGPRRRARSQREGGPCCGWGWCIRCRRAPGRRGTRPPRGAHARPAPAGKHGAMRPCQKPSAGAVSKCTLEHPPICEWSSTRCRSRRFHPSAREDQERGALDPFVEVVAGPPCPRDQRLGGPEEDAPQGPMTPQQRARVRPRG